MRGTKDQTIARLEGEVGRYGTELAIKLSTIARLEAELKEANSAAAARDERDRRIRLEEAEWWEHLAGEHCDNCSEDEHMGCIYCRRMAELRAPVPAEVSVKTYACGTTANGPQIPDICPIHGTECEVRAQWAKQVAENVQDRLGDK